MSEGPIDLYRRNIPPEIISLVPSSVARENLVVPVSLDDQNLVVAMADPDHVEAVEKLQFILNRSIRVVEATRQAIQFAILRYYSE